MFANVVLCGYKYPVNHCSRSAACERLVGEPRPSGVRALQVVRAHFDSADGGLETVRFDNNVVHRGGDGMATTSDRPRTTQSADQCSDRWTADGSATTNGAHGSLTVKQPGWAVHWVWGVAATTDRLFVNGYAGRMDFGRKQRVATILVLLYFKTSWCLLPRGAEGLAPPEDRRAFNSVASCWA